MILAQLQREVSIDKAHASKKMFVVKQTIGEETLHKLLCFIIKAFQDSLKITTTANEMTASEIFEAADMLMGMGSGEYGRESVFDVIMALKQFKAQPFELFNAFSEIKLRKIITNYLEQKADWLVKQNRRLDKPEASQPMLTTEQVRSDYERSVRGETMIEKVAQEKRKEAEYEAKRSKAAHIVKTTIILSEPDHSLENAYSHE